GGARGGPPADAAAGDRAWDGAWTPGAGPGPGAVPAAVRPGAAAGAGRAPARTGRPDRLGGPATGSPAHEAPRAAWLRRSAWVAGVGHSVTHRGHVPVPDGHREEPDRGDLEAGRGAGRRFRRVGAGAGCDGGGQP